MIDAFQVLKMFGMFKPLAEKPAAIIDVEKEAITMGREELKIPTDDGRRPGTPLRKPAMIVDQNRLDDVLEIKRRRGVERSRMVIRSKKRPAEAN